ncbi:MAG TPA: TonB-dependent receptor [Cyclobacteriaceae bacterium]|nr:TonB-dependent receptor [Cyclobacteriaceae bacterium]
MRIFLLAALLVPIISFGQQKSTVSGYIKDKSNGEELIGVTVYVNELQTGTVTNVYGFYSLTLSPGTYHLQFSYIGFTTQVREITLTNNVELNMNLAPEVMEMEEIVVTAERDDANVTSLQMSKREINIDQVRKLPAVMGEVDIIKNVQMQPGVISAGEGTSSYFVRGGSADQNLILIDEAPIYDPSHLFGLFSVFNADVIKESELYRGGIPSRFGGRLSSILEVRTKDGNNQHVAGSGGIGSLASRLMIEGPLRKDKSSFIVSGRRSYADLFLKAAGKNNTVSFYDINTKMNWKPDNKNRYYLAFYAGRDEFKLDQNLGFGWGNATGTFRWNHLFTDRLFSNTTFIASNFDYKLDFDDPLQGFVWKSRVQQFSINNDLTYFITPENELSFGYQVSYRRFQPGVISPNSENSIYETVRMDRQFALDHALYIDNQQKLSDKVNISYGARLSIFQNIGKADIAVYADPTDNVTITRIDTLHYGSFENIKTYINVEPRFSLRYAINDRSSIKASYNRMVQNTHLITNGTIPVPFNTWNPSGYYLKPQIADQVALGYFRNLSDHNIELSAEAFYKELQDVTEFADNANVFFNKDLAVEFRQGKSTAYGIEFLAEKTEGKFTGFASYTLSKVTRTVPGVNQGRAYLANYDRRHVFNAAATYEFSRKWTFGATFTYSSGRPITIPSGRYEFEDYNVDMITERNAYKLAPIHRLDLSATLTPQKNKDRKWHGQWVFSLYNVYNRQNPFTLYTRTMQDEDGNIVGDGSQKEARMVYLFPVIPSVTYNFKF